VITATLPGSSSAAPTPWTARAATTAPVTSLRQHTRAAALRRARSCYDHLAGRAGVALTASLLDRGALASTDGAADTGRRAGDPLSAPLPRHPYRLGPRAEDVFAELGVDLTSVREDRCSRRPLLRFCLDWSEQRHHLGGRLGAAVLAGLFDQGWVERGRRRRVLTVTEVGTRELDRRLGLEIL
jgi:hypothetical protein